MLKQNSDIINFIILNLSFSYGEVYLYLLWKRHVESMARARKIYPKCNKGLFSFKDSNFKRELWLSIQIIILEADWTSHLSLKPQNWSSLFYCGISWNWSVHSLLLFIELKELMTDLCAEIIISLTSDQFFNKAVTPSVHSHCVLCCGRWRSVRDIRAWALALLPVVSYWWCSGGNIRPVVNV